MTEPRRRKRKILIAVMAALSSAAIVVPVLLGLLAPRLNRQAEMPTTPTTTTAPVLTIKPLPVRPVISAFVTTPEQCPPPAPTPPDKQIKVCDIDRIEMMRYLKIHRRNPIPNMNPGARRMIIMGHLRANAFAATGDHRHAVSKIIGYVTHASLTV